MEQNSLIGQLGGYLIQSKLGEGSTFSFRINGQAVKTGKDTTVTDTAYAGG